MKLNYLSSLFLTLSSTLLIASCSSDSENSSDVAMKAKVEAKQESKQDNVKKSDSAIEPPTPPGMMPPSPKAYPFKQPDGTQISLYLKGGPCLNWEEDEGGYTVIKQGERYFYAEYSKDNTLVATQFEVGKVEPSELNLEKHLKPKPEKDCPVQQ